MTTHELKVFCTHCDVRMDAHDETPGSRGRPPREGDVAVCIWCLGLSVFVNGPMGLGVRQPTDEEERMYRADPRFRDLPYQARKLRREERG